VFTHAVAYGDVLGAAFKTNYNCGGVHLRRMARDLDLPATAPGCPR
jgi:hypothetical protein